MALEAMKFEETWSRGFKRRIVQKYGLMDGPMGDSGRRMASDHNSSS